MPQDDYVSCGANEVVTAFGGSDEWLEFIVRVTCTSITDGAVVTDNCVDFIITSSMGAKSDFRVENRSVRQQS